MSIELKVRGQEKLARLSRNLANVNINNNVQQAMVGAGQRIMTAIKGVTPVDTGFLKASIKISSEPSQNRVTIAEHSMQRAGTPYGYFVHEGTSKMGARPYFDWGAKKELDTLESMSKRLGKKLAINILKGI